LVDYLLRTLAAARVGEIPSVSPRIQAALDFLEGKTGEWLPVPELAARSGLSVPRFKARFRAEIGMPPGEFMLRRKIDAARGRLARTGRDRDAASPTTWDSPARSTLRPSSSATTLRSPSSFRAGS